MLDDEQDGRYRTENNAYEEPAERISSPTTGGESAERAEEDIDRQPGENKQLITHTLGALPRLCAAWGRTRDPEPGYWTRCGVCLDR
jgi:hypothetical protein